MSARTQSQQTWLIGGAAVAVLIALLGWFFSIHPEFSKTASLRSQTDDVNMQNVTLSHQVSQLKQQDEQIDSLRTTLATKVLELPADAGVQDYTRQLLVEANSAKVTLTALTAGTPSLATGVTNSAVSPTLTGANASAAGKLFSIPISITSTGSLRAERAFIKSVQAVGPRRALVTSAEFAPLGGSKAPSVDTAATMTLQVSIFVAPQSAAQEKALEKQLTGK